MDLTPLSNQEGFLHFRSPRRPTDHDAEPLPERRRELDRELERSRLDLQTQQRALHDTQAALDDALQRYAVLFDRLPIGFVTLTTKGRIVQANATAAQWLRCDRSQLAGSYMNWFLDAFDAGRFAAHLEACAESETGQLLEVTLRLDNGLMPTVQLSSRRAPPDRGGDPLIHTALISISKLRQAQLVGEDIEHEHATFMRAVSHELDTPLATISNLIRLVLHDHAADLSTGVKDVVERIECAAVRMEATLQQLLDYCSLGCDELVLDPVNLDELVQRVIVELRATLRDRASDVIVDRPLPCVRGAPLLLGQVLANVITDALRSHEPGRPFRVHIAARTHDKIVCLKITEDAAALLPEAGSGFRVIERLHGPHNWLGNGVAMTIISHAIERMKGRATVESAPEKERGLTIELPLA